MSQNRIDLEHTQVYGNAASTAMMTFLVGLVSPLDVVVDFFSKQLDGLTKKVGQLLVGSRGAKSKRKSRAGQKKPALVAARKLLGRFSKHLGAHKEGVIDANLYFLGGALKNVGKAVLDVLNALHRVAAELKKKDCPVTNASAWYKEFVDAASQLEALAAETAKAHADQTTITPQLAAAVNEWRNGYNAAKCAAEAILRSAGKLELMTHIFPDLALAAPHAAAAGTPAAQLKAARAKARLEARAAKEKEKQARAEARARAKAARAMKTNVTQAPSPPPASPPPVIAVLPSAAEATTAPAPEPLPATQPV